MEVLYFIAVGICLLLFILILNKKKNSIGDKIFATWQFILILHFGLLYIRHSHLVFDYPYLIGLDSTLVLLHLPFVYFYVNYLIGKSLTPIRFLKHLLPFFLFSILFIFSFFILSSNDKIEIYNDQLSEKKLYSIIDIVLFIQFFIYLPKACKLIKSYSKNITSKYSNIDSINLKWLKLIILGLSITYGSIFYYIFFISLEIILVFNLLVN